MWSLQILINQLARIFRIKRKPQMKKQTKYHLIIVLLLFSHSPLDFWQLLCSLSIIFFLSFFCFSSPWLNFLMQYHLIFCNSVDHSLAFGSFTLGTNSNSCLAHLLFLVLEFSPTLFLNSLVKFKAILK